MKAYVDLVRRILDHGEYRTERTGVGAFSVFGGLLKFDLRRRFPLVTLKETRYRVAFLEMLWFLRGEPNTDYLMQHDCKLWEPWTDGAGRLGPVYGVQWRSWGSGLDASPVDQIKNLIQNLRDDPHSRRHLVSAWNVAQIPDMALPPCHWAFQCFVSEGRHLDMMVHQRSWDVGLGAPFNIAQYALLQHLIARATGLTPRFLKFTYGDAHIYENHRQTLADLLYSREIIRDKARLVFNTDNTDIDKYEPCDFRVEGYSCHPHVPLPVAV